MISFGTNITCSTEGLNKIPFELFIERVRCPKNQQFIQKINQLRLVRQLDSKRYAELKKSLPYVVCGVFNPAFRRISNFAYTRYFILDIDHIAEKGLVVSDIKENLKKDPQVLACFVSPSEDGVKVVFKFKERCYDAGLYSMFYRQFVYQFGRRYGLDQVVDNRVCDVTRACFMSYDPDVYYNPQADLVDTGSYVDTDNPSIFFESDRLLMEEMKNAIHEPVIHSADPDGDALERIKNLLLPVHKRPVVSVDIYVPPMLNEVIAGLVSFIQEVGVEVSAVENIQYGKKIKMRLGVKLAECNVFYGKKGFSVVQSPKGGTNPELNKLMSELIMQYIESL